MLTTGTPVAALVRKGNQVRFSLPMASVSFSGQLDGETLTERWSDGSRSHFQFIGHSQDGMVGPLAAVDNPQVAWMVLLAAPGVPIAQMLEASARHWPPRKA